MKMKKLILACLSLVLVCSMTACSAKPSATQNKEEFALRVAIADDAETLDPTRIQGIVACMLVNHLFEGLMRYEVEGDAAPKMQYGQAQSHSVSEDGLTYRFVLRDDIFWSDGKPVVAEDFIYSWHRLIDPATNSNYASLISMVENATAIQNGEKEISTLGVKAIDEKTLEIKLTQKCTYFLELFTLPFTFPLRKDMIEANGEKWYQNTQAVLSNGAYTMDTWERDDKLVFSKNERYYDVKKIGPDSLNFTVIGDAQQALALFTNKQLDVLYNLPVLNEDSMRDSTLMASFPMSGLYTAFFNTQTPPFTDPRVREAFSLAVDRNAIVANSNYGETPLAAFIPYGVTDRGTGEDFRKVKEAYISVKTEDYAANCEKAKKLLAEAGFENGENFPPIRLVNKDTVIANADAEILAQTWESVLGVTVEQIPIPLKSWWLNDTKDYHIRYDSWIADYNDPTTFLNLFKSTDNFGFSKYNNPQYDALLQKAEDAPTIEERYALLHSAEDMLFVDHPVAPLYSLIANTVSQENITGILFNPTQTISFKHVQQK